MLSEELSDGNLNRKLLVYF